MFGLQLSLPQSHCRFNNTTTKHPRFMPAITPYPCLFIIRQRHKHEVSFQRIRHPLFFSLRPPPPIGPPLIPPPLPPLYCGRICLSSFRLISIPTAVSTASSNTSCTPFISLLLHSTYVAPICLATFCPCSCVTGVRPWVLSRSMQVRLVRRSDFRPMRMRGVVGQKWRTSGYHCFGACMSVVSRF